MLAVGVAVVTSLVAGVWAGDTFDAARVLGLLPVLRAGPACHTRAGRPPFDARRRPGAGGAVLLAIGVLAIWTDRIASTEWLYYRARYVELDVSDARALLTRAGVMLVALVGAWAFLTLLPRAGGWFTRMGAFTLVVYLVHGFVVLGAEYAGVPAWADGAPGPRLRARSASRRWAWPCCWPGVRSPPACSTSSTPSAWPSARSARPST